MPEQEFLPLLPSPLATPSGDATRNITALSASGNRLLLTTCRRLAVGADLCPALSRDYQRVFGERACTAHSGARAFLTVASQAAGRRLDVAPPGWQDLTGDEARLLALLAAAETAPDATERMVDFCLPEPVSPAALDRLLAVMSAPARRRQLRAAAQMLALDFTSHGLTLVAPPLPARPLLTVIPGGLVGRPIGPRGRGRLRLVR